MALNFLLSGLTLSLIVWIAISQARAIVSDNWIEVIEVVSIVTVYHGFLLLSCWGMILISGLCISSLFCNLSNQTMQRQISFILPPSHKPLEIKK